MLGVSERRTPKLAHRGVSRPQRHPPRRNSDLTVVSSCTCTVEGRTGTVTFSERATVDLDGIITVDRKIIDATGDLEGLRGKLEVSDLIAAPAQAYTGRYDLD